MTGKWQLPRNEEVCVWTSDLNGSAARLAEALTFLSDDERERANRFHFDIDRRRFIRARSTLRQVLGGYLGIAPAKVRFQYNAQGKPGLGNAIGPQFNLSHSGDKVVIAVADVSVGVDIECLRDVDLSIAQRYFSPDEVAALIEFPGHSRREAFFRCWTRKEALSKALGEGLNLPLDSFSVSLGPSCSLLRLDYESEKKENWTILNLEFSPEILGAVAVRSPAAKLSYMETFDDNN